MQAFGLYTHIRANRIRSLVLIGGMFLLVYVILYALALLFEAFVVGGDLGFILARAAADFRRVWPWGTLGAAAWIAIAYAFNQALVDAVTGAGEITREQEPRLWNLLENLCISRGLKVPRLQIMEVPELNAFATGLNERQYAITVTRGLLDTLNDAELEAVLGHELTHIRNGDVRLMVIAGVMAGVVSFFGELVFRWLANTRGFSFGMGDSRSSSSSDSREGKGGGGAFAAVLIAIALLALSWLLSQVIKFALSRRREFLADAGSVELTKNPDAMISALQKIDGRGELPHAPSGLMEMCVDNPRSGFADIFATHPSIQSRVDTLVRYAGGHVREPAKIEDHQTRPWGEPAQVPADQPSEVHEHGPWGDRPLADAPNEADVSTPGSAEKTPPSWTPRGRSPFLPER